MTPSDPSREDVLTATTPEPDPDGGDPWDLDPDLPFHPYVACPEGGCGLPANHDNGMAFSVAESMAKNAIRAVREQQKDPTDHVTAVMVSDLDPVTHADPAYARGWNDALGIVPAQSSRLCDATMENGWTCTRLPNHEGVHQ